MGNESSTPALDMSFDMTNPPVPFKQALEGGLKAGKMMFIEGMHKGDHGSSDKFNINFYGSKEEDIIFHYDVRFRKHDTNIVMNSRHKGKWEAEERLPNNFSADKPFAISVQINNTGFTVSHDQSRPHTFNFRNNSTPQDAKLVTIAENVVLTRVYYGYGDPRQGQQQQTPSGPGGIQMPSGGGYQMPSGGGYQMPSGGGYQMPSQPPSAGFTPQGQPSPQQLIVPVRRPASLAPGRQVLINGIPKSDANRFSVNLEDNSGQTILLHIAVRFDENAVVRNSCRNGQWEQEERQGQAFPFRKQEPFQLQVLCEQNEFKIAVNGFHFTEFRHRGDFRAVEMVRVEGDVTLVDFQIF